MGALTSRGFLIGATLLSIAFLLELVRQASALPAGAIGDIVLVYIQLTLPPTALLVFVVAGLFAPPAPFLAGLMLGLLDAALITVLVLVNPQEQLEGSGIAAVAQGLVPLWAIAAVVGAVVTGTVGSIVERRRRRRSGPHAEVEPQSIGVEPTSGASDDMAFALDRRAGVERHQEDGQVGGHPVDDPIRVKTYRGETAEAAARMFQADAADAAKAGFLPISQQWEGSTLTVIYQRQEPTPPMPPPKPDARIYDDGPPKTIPGANFAPISPLADEKTETTISAIGMIVGGAMMAAGAFLPWISASTGLGSVSRGGMEGGDGMFIAALGGLTILGGIAALLGNPGWAVAIFGSLVGGFLGFLDFQEVQRRVADAADSVAVVEVGIGMWLILAGAIVAFIGALISWRAARRRTKATGA